MATSRLYPYVGSKEIAERCFLEGTTIRTAADVLRWLRVERQELDESNCVTTTFVIDEHGRLRVADRHSEHVACANARPVQSAGEITFHVAPDAVEVVWVTNQSTGYCPEPESWSAVESTLTKAGLVHPSMFDVSLAFRRCPTCGAINIVKDAVFECAICGEPLPVAWNLSEAEG